MKQSICRVFSAVAAAMDCRCSRALSDSFAICGIYWQIEGFKLEGCALRISLYLNMGQPNKNDYE